MTESHPQGAIDILDEPARKLLLAHGRVIRVQKGQPVISFGDKTSNVFLVQEGELEVVLYTADGRQVSLRNLRRGQLFGELAAIDGAPRSVGITANTDSRLLCVSAIDFRGAVQANPLVADWLLRRLASQIRSLTTRVFELSTLNVKMRLYCELIRMAKLQSSGFVVKPTHEDLANKLGTHREAITRELRDLAQREIIETGRRNIKVLDLPALEALVSSTLLAPTGPDGTW